MKKAQRCSSRSEDRKGKGGFQQRRTKEFMASDNLL